VGKGKGCVWVKIGLSARGGSSPGRVSLLKEETVTPSRLFKGVYKRPKSPKRKKKGTTAIGETFQG